MISVSLVTPSTRLATSSPKRSRDLLERRARVLDGVVQQRRAERLGVEAQAGADPRDPDRVDDELLAGAPALVGVVLAGEHERRLRRASRSIATSASSACSSTIAKRSPSSRRSRSVSDARRPRRSAASRDAALRRLPCSQSQVCQAVLVAVARMRGTRPSARGVTRRRCGHGRRGALPVEIDEADLREDPQQAPGELGRPLRGASPTQDRLELPPGRAAPVAKRPVAGGKRVAETVLLLMYVHRKA